MISNNVDFTIRSLRTMVDAEGVVEVQRRAWQMSDLGIVPTFETRAVSESGFVYIATDKKDVVVGFIYGYHHFPDIHYSHMMAVLPEWQDKGVGFSLKKFHRNQAISSKYHVQAVQWTVDPLLPNNAYLNFAKLGCYCNTYKVNYYGDPSSDGVEIYAGVPTDRFLVTWPIHNKRVSKRIQNYRTYRISKEDLLSRSPSINIIKENQFVSTSSTFGKSFSVQVPGNYQEIRSSRIDLAIEWRIKFREISLLAFKQDYSVIDYHGFRNEQKYENFYEFAKEIYQ